jgi:hypothetical protein
VTPLDLGIERAVHLGPQNRYEIFWENFEGILDTRPESGIDSLHESAQPSSDVGEGR